MVTFINSLTGTEMFVADDRKEEYLAAGHKLAVKASDIAKKTESVKTEEKKVVPKATKAPVKRSAATKKK